MHIKQVTLTSKKNWWMVEMDEEEKSPDVLVKSFSSEETAVAHPPPYLQDHPHTLYRQESLHHHHHHQDIFPQHEPHVERAPTPSPSLPIFNPPRHPTSIFSFPTPTSYAAPPDPTASLMPFAHGSASEVFRCVVKKPDVIQLEINDEMQSNATDVTTQFLAELRVYTTLPRQRNIAAFLGCLENVGMVLEYIEGRTLYDIICERPMIPRAKKIDYHNQLLDGLTHLHAYKLSHGDLSLLNVQVTVSSDTIKLLDFGRSVHADSTFVSPDDESFDPFDQLDRNAPKKEQIHPGTRPFCAPEILRGKCQDPLLADAYSFGVILVALDKCEAVDMKPSEQRMDLIPPDFLEGCELFGERATLYLRKWTERRRLMKEDMVETP